MQVRSTAVFLAKKFLAITQVRSATAFLAKRFFAIHAGT